MALINANRIPAEAFEDAKPERGTRFANRAAIISLVEYGAFALLGTTWRFGRVPYLDGGEITRLQIEALDIKQRAERHAKWAQRRGEEDPQVLRQIAIDKAAWIEQVVAVCGPLMIPTGKNRLRYKLSRYRPFRKLWANPLMGQSEAEVGAAFGFLALYQTNSEARARLVARLN